MFDPNFFINNRKRLRQASKADLLIIAGNGLLQRNGDSPYAFRQDSNFWYLCGVSVPDAILLINRSGEATLILQEQSPNEKVFGMPNNLTALKMSSGVDQILEGEEGMKLFKEVVNKTEALGMCSMPPGYSERYGMFTNPGQKRVSHLLRQMKPGAKRQDIRPILSRMRMIKQAPEISAIQKAIAITSDTMAEVAGQLSGYKNEYEIKADVLKGFYKRGADGEAFSSIVASGRNTCQLHYQDNNAELAAGLLYMDIGAEYSNYASDITRTYFLGNPTKRMEEVVYAVKRVAKFATSLAKPGVTVRENERKISHEMGEELIKLGLIKENNLESVRRYFPHGTSHYMGLDVHDVGDYDAPLEPGIVMTIEPGIYIPEEEIGVRIEDDILITKSGCNILSGHLPA